MPRHLLVPGFMGSGPGHWQRHWLGDEPDAILLDQDDFHAPRLEAWLDRLEDGLARWPGATIIAHSLGAILVAHLATRPSRHLVGAAMLVAPCDLATASGLHPGQIGFGAMPNRPLPFQTTVVASRNDPYMPLPVARHHAGIWDADLIDIGLAGHVNIASGFGRWAEGREIAARLEWRAREHRASTVPAFRSGDRRHPRITGYGSAS